MPFLAVGVEHKTAPLDVRERLTFDRVEAALATSSLTTDPSIEEAIILSTCNRTEVYLFASDPQRAEDLARALLVRSDPALTRYVHTWQETATVERIFRVACSLESQIPGETQIASQVGDALDIAQTAGTVGPNLHALFRAALSCARQARAATTLGQVNVSVGSQAVELAEASLGDVPQRTVLLIGGGEVSKLVAEELRRRDVGALYIANRTDSVAHELANRYGGTPVPLDDIAPLVSVVDALFTATTSPHFVLTAEWMSEVLAHRTSPLHIFDLAMPRDVEPAVAHLAGVILHDLDDLLPTSTGEAWSRDMHAMEAVLGAEIQEFTAWYHTRRVAPVIASLRSHVEAVQRQEMKRIAPQIKDLTERERAAVESMGQRLVDKMFHHLVLRLRLAAQTDPALVDAAEFFFLHGEGSLFEHAARSNPSVEIKQ